MNVDILSERIIHPHIILEIELVEPVVQNLKAEVRALQTDHSARLRQRFGLNQVLHGGVGAVDVGELQQFLISVQIWHLPKINIWGKLRRNASNLDPNLVLLDALGPGDYLDLGSFDGVGWEFVEPVAGWELGD